MNVRASQAGAFALLCAVWGSTWLAIKLGVETVPTFLSAMLRFVIAASTLLALAALLRRKLPRTRSEWGAVLLVGVALFTLDYGLIYWGESNGVESGLSAVLFATLPLQTAVWAHGLLAKERLTVQKLVGIGVGFGGILLIFRAQLATAGPEKLLPMLAIVLSSTCAGLATVTMKRWAHDTDPFTFNGLAMAVGTAGLAVISLGTGEPWAVPSWPEGLLPILYLALAGSVVTFVAYMWLLRQVEATTASFVSLITPIIAVLLGFAVAQEILEPLDIVGTAVTLLGIYLATSRKAAEWVRNRFGLRAPTSDSVAPGTPNGKR